MSQVILLQRNPTPGSGPVFTLTGNSGGAVSPDGVGNINTIASVTQGTARVVGDPGMHTTAINFTDADFNTGLGTGVLGAITTADQNTALGYQALNLLTSGNTNTAIGDSALATLLTGSNNIALGQTAGINLVGAESDNILIGFTGNADGKAGYSDLVALGNFAHNYGSHNTFVGNNSGNLTLTVVSADFNTGIGDQSLKSLTTGDQNAALGYLSLGDLTTGSSNTALGDSSLSTLLTGSNNIAVGQSAGINYVGAESGNILIGSEGVAAESDITRIGYIGGSSSQTECFIDGIWGVNVGSVASVASVISTGQLGETVITAGTGISVTPGANSITIASTGASNPVTTLHTQDGNNVTATAGVINLSGGNSLTTTGTVGPNTATISLTGITQYNVQTGGASNALNNVAPGATSGVPLISQGAASQPIFGTALIAGGGTASTSFNTTGVVISGATSTTALAAVTLTDGQLAIGSSAGNPAAATLTAGANITITNGHNSITIAANAASEVVNYTGVNHAASPYTVLSTDYYISADVTAGVISILLPNAPTTGRVFVVKDKVGLAATSNITVTTVGGAVTIDGATTFVMNTAYESAEFIFNGTSYEVW